MEKNDKISRRKILATMGLTSAAVATGAIIPGFDGQASANPNRDADQNLYQLAEHLPERTVAQKLRETISVKDFGAKGDGVTDDSQAIKQAIEYVLQQSQGQTDIKKSIFFPTGKYIITKDKLFSDIDLGNLGQPGSPVPGSFRAQGITFHGENRRSSVLHLVTNGTEKWFYDNESIDTEKLARLNFEHLRFETDDPLKGNGFKQWSQGWDKQFRYYSCDFSLGKIMQFEGTGNADLNRFLMCNITAYDYAFTFNNAQSVSTELITTETSTRKGLVDVLDKGGGAFRVISGNHEMHPHPTDTEDHYFIRIAQDARVNLGNGDFNITDGRFEMHGSNKKLVKTNYSYQGAVINFTRCSFGTVSGGKREIVDITPSKRLVFDNCMLNENFLYKASGRWQGSGSPTGAEIYFLNCITGRTAGQNLWERVIVEDNAYRVVAERCTKTFGTKGISGDTQDFDFGWENRLPTSFPANKKIMAIKPGWLGFPLPSGSSESTIKLPHAYITKIYIEKPAINSTSASYQLFIGSDDKSTVLGSSELAPHKEKHVIEVDNLGFIDFETIRLWAEGDSTAGQSSGTAFIEYI